MYKYTVTISVFCVNMPYCPMADVYSAFLDTVRNICAVIDCSKSKLVPLFIKTLRVTFFDECILEVTHLPFTFYLLTHSIRLCTVYLIICSSIFHELQFSWLYNFSQLILKKKKVDLFPLSFGFSVMSFQDLKNTHLQPWKSSIQFLKYNMELCLILSP